METQTPKQVPGRRGPVENPPAFISLDGAQAWPYAMTAHWRSRLRIGHGKGVREQGTEPGNASDRPSIRGGMTAGVRTAFRQTDSAPVLRFFSVLTMKQSRCSLRTRFLSLTVACDQHKEGCARLFGQWLPGSKAIERQADRIKFQKILGQPAAASILADTKDVSARPLVEKSGTASGFNSR